MRMLRSEKPRAASASPMCCDHPRRDHEQVDLHEGHLSPIALEHQGAGEQPRVLAAGEAVGARPAAQVVAGPRRDVGLADAGPQPRRVGARRESREGGQGEDNRQPAHRAEDPRDPAARAACSSVPLALDGKRPGRTRAAVSAALCRTTSTRSRGPGRLPLHRLPAPDGQSILRDRCRAPRCAEGRGDTIATYATTGDDHGQDTERSFCSACGAPVFSIAAVLPRWPSSRPGRRRRVVGSSRGSRSGPAPPSRRRRTSRALPRWSAARSRCPQRPRRRAERPRAASSGSARRRRPPP